MLHMFFSPYRVAKGLTKDEVKMIIEVYPLLGSCRRSAIIAVERFLGIHGFSFSSRVSGTILPEELTSVDRMTRRRFRDGLRKLLRLLT